MGITKYKNADEWETHVMNEVSPKWFKANKALGVALNIATPATLLFAFHFNIFELMLAYIGFDAAMVGVDYLSIGAYKGKTGIAWMSKRKDYIDKVNGMTIDEVKEERKLLQAHSRFYKEKLAILDEKIAEHNSVEKILSNDRHFNDIKTVQAIIERMRAYSDDDIPFDECKECIKWIQEKIAKIVKKSDELIEIANNSPGTISLINNTYDIYAEEMMSIILNYQTAAPEQQEKMEPGLCKLLDAFYDKLSRLFKRIYESKEFSLGVDIDYLTKRLNEDIEEDGTSEGQAVDSGQETAEERQAEEPDKEEAAPSGDMTGEDSLASKFMDS